MSIGAGTPRGQRASAIRTFVIADVRGYTAFSKQHGDEAGARLATTFAEIAREGVEAAGGELTETRGDEILASFDSARRALRAAVELQDAFADEMAIEPSLPLTVGIGIAAGEAVPVGDGFRGRALNLAARLCSKASAGEVLVGEELLGLAGPMDGIELASIEPLELKGFDEPVPVVKVAASSVVAPPAPEWFGERGPRLDLPRELDPAGPIMGRERELRFLRWHWRRARHGHGRGAFVLGPSGMGKTRLVAALAREALAAGAAVRYARCAGRRPRLSTSCAAPAAWSARRWSSPTMSTLQAEPCWTRSRPWRRPWKPGRCSCSGRSARRARRSSPDSSNASTERERRV